MANEWININDQKPEDGQRVLIAIDKYASMVTVADFVDDHNGVDWTPDIKGELGIGEDDWEYGRYYFHQYMDPWHNYDLDQVFWWAPIPDRLDI